MKNKLLPIFLLFFSGRGERPEDWVPAEAVSYMQMNKLHGEYSEILESGQDGDGKIVDIFSIHSGSGTGNSFL